MSLFPGSIDSFTSVSPGDVITSALMNDVTSAVVAIEDNLGVNAQGSFSTVGDAIAAKADISDIQAGDLLYAADTGVANAYAVALSPAPPTYTAGQMVLFQAANANTASSTLAVNGQAATPLVLDGGVALSGGEIAAGQIVACVYDGAAFQMVGSASSGGSGIGVSNTVNEFRLTTVSGTPIPGDDASSAFISTLYFTPYIGNRIALYDSGWQVYSSAEISLDVSAMSDGVYDLFVYTSGGLPTLEAGPAWTDDNTRSTDIVLLDGVYVSSADSTRRYAGSFLVGTGFLYDWPYQRYVYNAQNRVPRLMRTNADTFSTNSNSWTELSGMAIQVLLGLTAESTMAWGTALGQGDGVSTACEIAVAYDYEGPGSYSPISGVIGTSTLTAPFCRVPDRIGVVVMAMYLQSSVDTVTVNLLDDGAGNNLTSILGIVWV